MEGDFGTGLGGLLVAGLLGPPDLPEAPGLRAAMSLLGSLGLRLGWFGSFALFWRVGFRGGRCGGGRGISLWGGAFGAWGRGGVRFGA